MSELHILSPSEISYLQSPAYQHKQITHFLNYIATTNTSLISVLLCSFTKSTISLINISFNSWGFHGCILAYVPTESPHSKEAAPQHGYHYILRNHSRRHHTSPSAGETGNQQLYETATGMSILRLHPYGGPLAKCASHSISEAIFCL